MSPLVLCAVVFIASLAGNATAELLRAWLRGREIRRAEANFEAACARMIERHACRPRVTETVN